MIIKNFNSYRDGGTISVICRIGGPIWQFYFDILNKTNMMGDEVEICIDGRFDKCPTVWIGYPQKEGSILIEDGEVIKHIISKIEDHKRKFLPMQKTKEFSKRIENHRMDCFINYEQNLRDWKIKNIINN